MSTEFSEVAAEGLQALMRATDSLREQTEHILCRLHVLRQQRLMHLACYATPPEVLLASLLLHERRQLALVLRAKDLARELRLGALKLDALQPLMLSGTLPTPRKESPVDAIPGDGGLLATAVGALEAMEVLRQIMARADQTQAALYAELRLGTADAKKDAAATRLNKPANAKRAAKEADKTAKVEASGDGLTGVKPIKRPRGGGKAAAAAAAVAAAAAAAAAAVAAASGGSAPPAAANVPPAIASGSLFPAAAAPAAMPSAGPSLACANAVGHLPLTVAPHPGASAVLPGPHAMPVAATLAVPHAQAATAAQAAAAAAAGSVLPLPFPSSTANTSAPLPTPHSMGNINMAAPAMAGARAPHVQPVAKAAALALPLAGAASTRGAPAVGLTSAEMAAATASSAIAAAAAAHAAHAAAVGQPPNAGE